MYNRMLLHNFYSVGLELTIFILLQPVIFVYAWGVGYDVTNYILSLFYVSRILHNQATQPNIKNFKIFIVNYIYIYTAKNNKKW